MHLSIGTLLSARQVCLDLRAGNAADAIRDLTLLLKENPAVRDTEKLCEEVIAREQANTTALPHGFALPHARTNAVGDIVLAVGRSRDGVRFGNEERTAHLIFLIGTPPEMIGQYLTVVGALARLLKDEAIRQCLIDAENEDEFLAVLN